MNQLDTKTKLDTGSGTTPKRAHLADKMQGCVTEGDYALCGAKLKGINDIPPGTKVCGKCIEIAQRRCS